MECPKCGNILDENETSCKNCGEKIKDNTLNQVSKVGGKTQLPTEEEQRFAMAAQQQVVQQQVQQPMQLQNNINPQEYMRLRQQLESAKKNRSLTLAIVVILIAVVATFGGILLTKKLNPNETKSIKGGTVSAQVEKKAEDPSTNPGTEVTKPTEPVSTDIEIGSYIFTFPSNYETSYQEGMGISIDYSNKVQYVYTIMNSVSYDQAHATMVDFNEYLNGVGFQVKQYQEVEYNGRKWIIFEGILNNMEAMYAITKMNSNATFQVTIFNFGNKENSVVVSELGKIIDSAKLKGSSSSGGSSSSESSSESSGSGSSGSTTKPSTGHSSGAVEA